VVAYPDQIAYYEHEDHLFEFTIDDMNYISMTDEGYIGLYFDDETDEPYLEDGLVVVTSMSNLWEEEDEDDWDVTLQDGLENL
jgi:hypothetical protein